MLLLSGALALGIPLLSRPLMQLVRRTTLRKKLHEISASSRDEVADQTLMAVTSKPVDTYTVGITVSILGIAGAMLASMTFYGLVISGVGAILAASILGREARKFINATSRRTALNYLDEVIDSGSKMKVEGTIAGLSRVEDPQLQLNVTNRALNWGSPWVIRHLDHQNQTTKYLEVKKYSNTWGELHRQSLTEVDANKLTDLSELIQRSIYWKRFANQSGVSDSYKLIPDGQIPTDPVHQSLKRQIELRQNFPHVYCTTCYTRGETEKIDANWTFIRCKTCKDFVNLVSPVREVQGIIGPEEKERLEGTVYPVNLWNEMEQKAIAVELDSLYVKQGLEINYDWAVSAALEAFRNRFPDYDKELKIEIDNGIALSNNTLNLLRSAADPESKANLYR